MNLDTITVARLIGKFLFFPESQTSNVAYTQRIDMGIQVVTEPAFSAAGASLPDPRVEADAPARGWLWRESAVIIFHNLNADEKGPYHYPEVAFDIRAMRKVDRGRLVFTMVKTAEDGTETNVTG